MWDSASGGLLWPFELLLGFPPPLASWAGPPRPPGKGCFCPGHPWRMSWGPTFPQGSGRSQGHSGPPLPTNSAGLSSDSGLGGSSDGSSDVLAFGAGSVVDSVTEEGGCMPPHRCSCAPAPLPPAQVAAPDHPSPRRGCRVRRVQR